MDDHACTPDALGQRLGLYEPIENLTLTPLPGAENAPGRKPTTRE